MEVLSRHEEIILLAVWKLKENAYGVTIREQILTDTGYEWTFGAIYKPLKRLHHKRYVEKTPGEPLAERGGRSRYFYRLTKSGFAALKEVHKIQQSTWKDIVWDVKFTGK